MRKQLVVSLLDVSFKAVASYSDTKTHIYVVPVGSMYVYMLYLPTFAIKNEPNLGKYRIHGWYGVAAVHIASKKGK